MPSHQTYGGSWKFLTFIDLVRRPPPFPRRPAREPVCVRGEHPRAARSHSALASPPAVASRGLAASHPALPGRWGTGGGRAQPAEVGYFEGNTALLLRGDTERFSTKQMDWTTLIMNGLRPLRPQGRAPTVGSSCSNRRKTGFLNYLELPLKGPKFPHKEEKAPNKVVFFASVLCPLSVIYFQPFLPETLRERDFQTALQV